MANPCPLRLRRAFSAALALAFLAAACGRGPPAGVSTPSPPAPAATGTPAPRATAASGVIDLSSTPPLLTALSADAGDMQTGSAPLASGDLNGDGLADLLIGAPYADGPGNGRQDAGEAYVIFGRRGLAGGLTLSPEHVGLTVYGARAGDSLGFALTAADLNGDGIDDLVLGAPGVTAGADPRTDQGRVYVIFGSPDLAGVVDLAAQPPPFDFVVTGAEGFSRAGHALAAGDVNGDGLADLIVGAPFAGREAGSPPGGPRTEVREVYVIFGSPSLAGEVNIAFQRPDVTIVGQRGFGRFGAAVAAADVNGDGLADVLVGAPAAGEGERRAAGAAYAFFGAADMPERLGTGEADIAVEGAEVGDQLGEPLAGGDFDGDGAAELLLVARLADGPQGTRQSAGEAYVLAVSGGSGRLRLDGSHLLALVYGGHSADLFATALAVADLDGDGRDDALFATALAGGPARTGAVYLLYGDDLAGTIDLGREDGAHTYAAGSRQERLGSGIAVGDWNGNGRWEVAVAAGGLPEDGRPGAVYVLPGPER